jgi:hypothetical protein
MSKRDVLLQTLLDRKSAGGENFFIFSIVTDAEQPTWEQRQSSLGGYEEAAALCVKALGVMAQNKNLQNGARIELYQGSAARAYLAESAIQESRYKRERESELNN